MRSHRPIAGFTAVLLLLSFVAVLAVFVVLMPMMPMRVSASMTTLLSHRQQHQQHHHPYATVTVADVMHALPRTHVRRFERTMSSSSSSSSISPARRTTTTTAATTSSLPTLYPTDFGADPTGVQDSSPAFDALLTHLLYNLSHPHLLSDGIIDLGGAVIDLAGGDYTISRPLVIPPGYGNLHMQRGTIRAMPSVFPAGRFMLQIGNVTSDDATQQARFARAHARAGARAHDDHHYRHHPSSVSASGQNCWIENVGVSNVMFDAQQSAAGCILINYCMGAVLGPQNFYLGFLDAGVSINDGHEVQIHASWFGEYLYSDPRKEKGNATAIEVLGNDHVVSDVVVFSAKVGLYVAGAANVVQNVHTWNSATGNGGTGIIIDSAGYTQNRVIASYLDYTDLVTIDPEHLLVADCFFLGGASLVVRASKANHEINGLVVRDNMWDVGSDTALIVDESAATFTALIDTVIDGNMLLPSFHAQSTRVRVAQTQVVKFDGDSDGAAPLLCFDLSHSLLMAQFAPTHVSTSVQVNPSADNPVTAVPVIAVVGGARAGGLPPNDQRSVCVAVSLTPAPTSPTSLNLTVYLNVDQSSSSQAWM